MGYGHSRPRCVLALLRSRRPRAPDVSTLATTEAEWWHGGTFSSPRVVWSAVPPQCLSVGRSVGRFPGGDGRHRVRTTPGQPQNVSEEVCSIHRNSKTSSAVNTKLSSNGVRPGGPTCPVNLVAKVGLASMNVKILSLNIIEPTGNQKKGEKFCRLLTSSSPFHHAEVY